MKTPRLGFYVVCVICAVCLLFLSFFSGCSGGVTKPTPIPIGPSPEVTAIIPTPTPTPPVHNITQDKYYATIQAAIDDAKNGDTIVVSPGTYYENIDFKGKNIIVQSSNPNNPQVVASTIIDGSKKGSVVTFQSGEGVETTITGFTIQNGTGTRDLWWIGLSIGAVTVSCGGGIYIRDSSPCISFNVIRNNEATSGGGIYITGISSPFIGVNTIEENRSQAEGGGIAVWGNASPAIDGNIIRNNQATANLPVYQFHLGRGGGIYISGSASVTTVLLVPWPRLNCPPAGITAGVAYDYQANTFFGNTHLGGTTSDGCHVYFGGER